MYMATCYQDLTWQGAEGLQELQNDDWPTLKQWAYTLYLQWIKNDPIDDLEVNRNNAVAEIQENRNLFVDYPYLAEYIWGDSIDVAFDPSTSITTAEDDNRYWGGDVVQIVSTPTFSPDGGTYTEEQTVTISCSTANTTIYYTVDGTSPTTNGIEYTAPLIISESTTLKAVAIDSEGKMSNVATAIYTLYDAVKDFYESFDLCDGTGGNTGGFSGNVASSSKTYHPDNEGWETSTYFGGDKCAKFGTSSSKAEVTTPYFTVNGTSTFTFKAAPWASDGNDLNLTISGNATLSESSFTMKEGEWTDFTTTITGSGSVAITFKPTKRFFLDEVRSTSLKKLGDVNRDGTVTIADVTALVDIILGKDATTPYTYDHDAADVNQDDGITIADVTALVDIILGK